MDSRGRSPFAPWLKKELDSYEQAVLSAAIKEVLEVMGIDICTSGWVSHWAADCMSSESASRFTLYGHSVRPTSSLRPGYQRAVLLRVFVTFHGDRVILLLHGLNKRRDPLARRQQKEIKKARQLLADWQRRRKADLA